MNTGGRQANCNNKRKRGLVCQFETRTRVVNTVQNILNDKVEILRARAERFRRLAQDILDPRTSKEAASLAQELDAEIAKLQTPASH